MSDGTRGELVVVGCGIQLGRHIAERAVSEIDRADAVLVLADSLAFAWIAERRPGTSILTEHYGEARDRRDSYRAMTDSIVDPGLLRTSASAACSTATRACSPKYPMRPSSGCEMRRPRTRAWNPASRQRPVCTLTSVSIPASAASSPSRRRASWPTGTRSTPALVLLWQVALAGNLDCIGFEPDPRRLRLLVDKLSHWYRPDTPIILYEAAQLPIERLSRQTHDRCRTARRRALKEYTTLVIPPAREKPSGTSPGFKALEALD